MTARRPSTGAGRLLIVAALAVVAALWTWTAPGDPDLWPPRAPQPGIEVHLLDNGFHTNLAVPRSALERRDGPLADAVRGLAPGDWVLIGWGDAKFYVDQRPITDRLPDGARAFFRPGNPSVLMLDPTHRAPADMSAEDGRLSFRLSDLGFDSMIDHIEGSLALSDGQARIAADRPGDDARFFAGREHFWIGRLCNHWSAGVLNAAGLPVRPLRAVTSAEVMDTVRRASADAGLDPAGGLDPAPSLFRAGSDPRQATRIDR